MSAMIDSLVCFIVFSFPAYSSRDLFYGAIGTPVHEGQAGDPAQPGKQ